MWFLSSRILFLTKDFIYLRERAHKQGEGEGQREKETLLSREPNVGLDPRTPGS